MGQTIACSKCGKQYAWKAELAGKTVRCACGQPITVAAAGAPEGDLLDFAPEPEAQAAPAKPPVDRAALNQAIRDRMGIIPGKTSETKERERLEAHREEQKQFTKSDAIRDTIIPIAITAAGFFLLLLETRLTERRSDPTMAFMIVSALMRSAFAVALLAGGMFLARAMLDVIFVHDLRQSALRFVAIAVGPFAVYGLMVVWMGDLAGPVLGVLITLVVYAILFRGLLLLSARDTAVCVLTTWILVGLAKYALFRMGAYQGSSPI